MKNLSYAEVKASFTSQEERQVAVPFSPDEISSFRDEHLDNSKSIKLLDEELASHRKRISDEKKENVKRNNVLLDNIIRGSAFASRLVYNVPNNEELVVDSYVLENDIATFVGSRQMTATERTQLHMDMPNVHQISKVM